MTLLKFRSKKERMSLENIDNKTIYHQGQPRSASITLITQLGLPQ